MREILRTAREVAGCGSGGDMQVVWHTLWVLVRLYQLRVAH